MIDRAEWRLQGRCANGIHPPSLWFPDSGRQFDPARRDAKRICNGRKGQSPCVVRDECLLFALREGYYEKDSGIWGGMTPRERNRFKRRLIASNRYGGA